MQTGISMTNPLGIIPIFLSLVAACSQTRLYHVDKAIGTCNDGSKPVFWYRSPVKASSKHKWMILLEGGGQCSSKGTCLERLKKRGYYTTSNISNYSSYFPTFSGMLNKNFTATKEMHIVMIHYCSSDGWHANKTNFELNSTLTWNLQGAQIIDDVLNSLFHATHTGIPGLSKDDYILLGGYSAGARGGMVNFDRLVQEQHLSQAYAYLDSPYYVTAHNSQLVNETKDVFSNFIKGTDVCARNNVSKWQDLFGQFRMPNVKIPFFLVASQCDSYQLFRKADYRSLVRTTHSELTKLKPVSDKSFILSISRESHSISHHDIFFQYGGYFCGEDNTFVRMSLPNLLEKFIKVKASCPATNTRRKYIYPVLSRAQLVTGQDCCYSSKGGCTPGFFCPKPNCPSQSMSELLVS
mmetsp:Transcript_35620/g.56968  ORF Transcript_35620/g.56968 Transcript_35620/m.56968 type:complete len:409 (-) Transcript_35620:230-1456(-)